MAESLGDALLRSTIASQGYTIPQPDLTDVNWFELHVATVDLGTVLAALVGLLTGWSSAAGSGAINRVDFVQRWSINFTRL